MFTIFGFTGHQHKEWQPAANMQTVRPETKRINDDNTVAAQEPKT